MKLRKPSDEYLDGPLTVDAGREYGEYRVREVEDTMDGRAGTDKVITLLFSAAPDLFRGCQEALEVISSMPLPDLKALLENAIDKAVRGERGE